MHDPFWDRRRTLVTGCSGFLGRWLVSTLVRKGARVIGFSKGLHSKLVFPADKLPDNSIIQVRGRTEKYDDLDRTIKKCEIDAVFHLAAQSIVGEAYENPLQSFQTNITGTWNLLEACRNSGCVTRVVTVSTEKVYGQQKSERVCSEKSPLLGDTPYAVSKTCADLLARTYHHSYGLPVSVARLSNVFGPGDLNYSRIIPGTIRSILNSENPAILSDGSPVRDYVFVQDIIDGFLLLAERMDDGPVQGKAFNFASGEAISVLDLINLLLEIAGRRDLYPNVLDTAHREPAHAILSTQQATGILGWRPKAALVDRLAETFDWYRDHSVRLGLSENA